MRISELAAREDYQAILSRTLAAAWSQQSGREVRVSFDAAAPGQRWRVQPLLSFYFTPDVAAVARRFMADGFRYASIWWRVAPQLALGTALATRAGLTLTSQPAFVVDPPIEGADHVVILPGNRRIRFFDFAAGATRVVLKDGFDDGAMRTEIDLRGGGRVGPFVPITASADDARWFQERIVEGYSLSRCPPWLPAKRLQERALRTLETWTAGQATEADPAPYAAGLATAIAAGLDRLRQRFVVQADADLFQALADRAAGVQRLKLGPTHGDCQPGNILIDRRGTTVVFTDWEFHGRRSTAYDRLVMTLRARWPDGLSQRLPADPRGALFLLEDVLRAVESAESGPFTAAPTMLTTLLSEAAAWLRRPARGAA